MFFLKYTLTIILLLFIPGYLLFRVIIKDKDIHPLELVPFSFGASLVIHLFICIITFILQLDIKWAIIFFVITISLLCIYLYKQRISKLLIRVRKKKIYDNKAKKDIELYEKKSKIWIEKIGSFKFIQGNTFEIVLKIFAILLLVVVVTCSYYDEMQLSTAVEDTNIISIATKIIYFNSLSIDNILYSKGMFYPYIIPFYSFILSSISLISGFEVVQVYIKIRYIFVILTFSTAFSLTRSLFPKDNNFPWIVITVSAITVISGLGKEFAGAYGQFYPFTIYQEFAYCVVLPICFLFFVKGIMSKKNSHFILAFFTSLSLFFIHARCALIFLFLSIIICFGMYYFFKEKRLLWVTFYYICSFLFFGYIIKYFQSFLPDDLKIYNKNMGSLAINKLTYIINGPSLVDLFNPLIIERNTQFLSGFNLFYTHPYYLFAFSLVPIYLFFNKDRGKIILGLSLLVPFLVIPIPIISLFLIYLTYDQFLWHGPGYFTIFQLIYISIIFFLLFLVNEMYQKFVDFNVIFIYFINVFLIILSLFVVVYLPQWIFYKNMFFFYIWFYLGTFIAVYYKDYINLFYITYFAKMRESLQISFFPLLVLFTFFYINVYFINLISPKFVKHDAFTVATFSPLYNNVQNILEREFSVVDWINWYNKSCYKHIPFDLISFVRNNIKHGSVFAAPFEPQKGVLLSLTIAALTPQYVYSNHTYTTQTENKLLDDILSRHFNKNLNDIFNTEREINSYLIKKNPRMLQNEYYILKRYNALMYLYSDIIEKYQPIFNNFDDWETTKRLIKKYSIEYIVTTPDWYNHLKDIQLKSKGLLDLIYDKDNFAIYKINFYK